MTDPRYALIREFRFSVDPSPMSLGPGRRAANRRRHEGTNYDQMLRHAGGLLHPDVYARVRLGVDRLIADGTREATNE